MAFFSRLLGRLASTSGGRMTTTARRPFVLESPVAGFLNLLGEQGAALADGDSRALSHFFNNCRSSVADVPQCAVLFVYCRLDPSGQVEGTRASLRELVKRAGARIAIVAAENEPSACIAAAKVRNDWPVNLVFVLNRKGPKFAEFFRRLFELMSAGTSMPLAWVKLAPQVPDHDDPNVPSAIFAAEAGHLTLGKR